MKYGEIKGDLDTYSVNEKKFIIRQLTDYFLPKIMDSDHITGPYRDNLDVEIDITKDYVNLGLPSGTLWAKMNIGASSPDEPGLYFQWGDISGYTSSQIGSTKIFDWSNYKYGNGANKLIKYCPSGKTNYWNGSGEPDNKIILDQEDDIVNVLYEGDWTMPTSAQFTELVNNTTHYWDADRGGMVFAANGEELFFLGTGYVYYRSVNNYGSKGYYWSRSLYESTPSYAWVLAFNNDGTYEVSSGGRYLGFPVRPVRSQNQ